MPPSPPQPPRIVPVRLTGLAQASGPPGRAEVRELERYDDLDLAGVDLQFSSLTECAFTRTRLDDAALRGSRLHQVIMVELDAARLSAPRAHWRELEISGSRIGSAELYESTWRSVAVTGGKINYLNARNADWADVRFTDCVLDELDLTEASVARMSFATARIGTLTTTGATLTDVDLRGASLSVVHGVAGLAGAWIDQAQLLALAPRLAAEFAIHVAQASVVTGE
jgi:uncharacterized protein YjbI with pentapeptide repeats